MISTPDHARPRAASPRSPSVLCAPLPLRGCVLCEHGTGPADARWCNHPEAPHAPVHVVRAPGGICGPEADLLHFPGLTA